MRLNYLCSLLLLLLVKQGHCACSADATFEKSCYVIPQAEADWMSAQRYCQSMEGNLATIETEEENAFVTNLINSKYSVQNVTIHTPNDYTYRYLDKRGVDVRGHTSITFSVQACNDVHLALSNTTNSFHDTYEVVIGGWADSQSVIRDCMQCAHMDQLSQQDHPLDCSQPHPFWLSWQDGHVRLGTGLTVGENEMLSWQDPSSHAVNSLGIATAWGAQGDWTFYMGSYRPGVFWLGISDLQTEGEWTRVNDLDGIEYSHWAPGQPTGAESSHCGAMDSVRGLQWIDADCQIRRNYVCEMAASEGV